MPKLGRKVLCPCGTGMTYEDCCLNRGIKWMVDEKGRTYRTVLLPPEATKDIYEFLKQQNIEFKKIFGRDMGPTDPIFFQDKYLGSPDDMTNDIVALLRKAELPPQKIYATRKTGLIPVGNYDNLTTKDIEDWNEAIDEYYEKLEEDGESPLDKEEPHHLKEVQTLLELLPNCLMLLAYVRDRRKTPIKDHRDVISISSTALLQFCIAKSEMNMKAIAKLLDNPNHRVDALNLTRSLYENYLTMVYARKQPQRIAEIFDARGGLRYGFYEYCTTKEGKVNRKKARDKTTGKEVSLEVKIKDMAESSDYKEDIEIHSYLYHFLSSYTHVDIGVIFDYFDEQKKHESEEINESAFFYEAIPLSLLVTSVILDETRRTSIVDTETMVDITRFLEKIVPKLIDFFDKNPAIYEDKDHSQIIKSRLQKISF